MKKKLKPKQLRKNLLDRVILPPEHYHTSKKGAHGYDRAQEKKEAREARQLRDNIEE